MWVQVRIRLHFLGEGLTEKVTAVLAGASEDAPPVPSGRWPGIWEKVVSDTCHGFTLTILHCTYFCLQLAVWQFCDVNLFNSV